MADGRIFVLADDLTGALEVGSKFAAAGVPALVRTVAALSPGELQQAAGAFVVDTESRHCAPAEAARRVYELAHAARLEGFSYFYKKTDSTLRGNIGAELEALVEGCGGSPLLYVPAYPAMGRLVRNGSLYVEGVPVNTTSFALDAFNPVRESHIPNVLALQSRVSVESATVDQLANGPRAGITVCDGESDREVEAAARAFAASSSFRLAAGSACFADHLARHIELPRCQPASLPCASNVLVVNGSLHEVSRQQVECARRNGFRSVESISISSGDALAGWTILEPAASGGAPTLGFGRCLAKHVREMLQSARVDMLVVFGGDTAYAIVEALGNPPLHSLGEVLEGIPVTRISAQQLDAPFRRQDRDLYLVTKAGGFGASDVLITLRQRLGEGESHG